MKVLLVTRGYPQKHNKNLGLFEKDQALALMRAGHDVAYAVVDIRSFRRKRKFGYNAYVDENGLKVYEMNWPMGPMPRFWIEYFRSEALLKLYPHILEEFGRPDVVHAHFLNYAVISTKLCSRENLPLVITEHSSYLAKEQYSGRIKRRAQRAYDACDALITVSKSLKDNIERQLGYKSTVISNIVDVRKYAQLNVKRNQSNDICRFVSAGNLLNRKRFDLLIDAFADAVKEEKEKKLYLNIWGDGPERKSLENLITRLNLKERVHLCGAYSRDDMDKVFGDSDAFVLASDFETFGVVYVEAMAFGLPVIGTRCGGPENFVTDKVGAIVERGHKEELTRAVLSMAAKIDSYNPEEIREFALTRFSPEVIASKITGVYEEVLSKRV